MPGIIVKHLLAVLTVTAISSPALAATYIGGTTYTGYQASSPFFPVFGSISEQDPNPVTETTSVYDFRGLGASVTPASGETYFFLEDVQDGQFDLPGVTFTGTGLVPRTGDGINGSNNGSFNTDNVAEDTLRLSSFRTSVGDIRADFNAADLGGQLPTYVGIVFAERTDNSLTTSEGIGRLVEAYDADDNLLEQAFAPMGGLPADGFVGVSTTAGIAYVLIDGDNEYDHFQYGFVVAVPEPMSLALLGLGCLGLLIGRRVLTGRRRG